MRKGGHSPFSPPACILASPRILSTPWCPLILSGWRGVGERGGGGEVWGGNQSGRGGRIQVTRRGGGEGEAGSLQPGQSCRPTMSTWVPIRSVFGVGGGSKAANRLSRWVRVSCSKLRGCAAVSEMGAVHTPPPPPPTPPAFPTPCALPRHSSHPPLPTSTGENNLSGSTPSNPHPENPLSFF